VASLSAEIHHESPRLWRRAVFCCYVCHFVCYHLHCAPIIHIWSKRHSFVGLFLSTRGSLQGHSKPSHPLVHHPPNPLSADQLLPPDPMSHTPVPTASGSTSNFQSIFNAALNNYKAKTKKDLLAHPLTTQLQICDSPSAILDILNKQYNIQRFIQSQNKRRRSKQWLNATVTVLCGLSGALGEGVGMVNLQRFPRQ
jgi:hypothetical protein